MFTKSGQNLMRISIPKKKELLPDDHKSTSTSNNHINNHITTILDNLVAIGCTITPLETNATTKGFPTRTINKNIRPIQTDNSFVEITPLSGNIPFKSNANLIIQKGLKPVKLRKVILSNLPNNKTNQHQKNKRKVSTASKAKNSISARSLGEKSQKVVVHNVPLQNKSNTKIPSKNSSNKSQSNVNSSNKISKTDVDIESRTNKIINDTLYISYTPETNLVQRERCIQVPSKTTKCKTIEIGVQYNQLEDDECESFENSLEDGWVSDLIEEYEFIDDNNMYECQICGEVCPSHLANHMHSMMHNNKSLLCFRCGHVFSNPSKLLAHENNTHADDKLIIKQPFRCPKLNCLKVFHSKRQLFDHIDLHTNRVTSTERKCNKCQKSFTTPLQLFCHINRKKCV